eukprot:m51a1_g5144 hypothetical protein (656) ;mRNA; f:28107-32360
MALVGVAPTTAAPCEIGETPTNESAEADPHGALTAFLDAIDCELAAAKARAQASPSLSSLCPSPPATPTLPPRRAPRARRYSAAASREEALRERAGAACWCAGARVEEERALRAAAEERLRAVRADAAEEIARVTAELESCVRDAAALKEIVYHIASSADPQQQQLEAQGQAQVQPRQEELSEQKRALEGELSGQKRAMEELSEQKRALEEELSGQKRAMEEERQRAARELAAARAEMEEYEARTDDLRRRLAEAQAQARREQGEAFEAVDAGRRELARANAEIDALQRDAAWLKGLVVQLTDDKAQAEQRLEQYASFKRVIQEIKDERDEAYCHADELQAQVDRLAAENAAIQERVERKRRTVSQLRSSVSASNAAMFSQLAALAQQLDAEKALHAQDRAQLDAVSAELKAVVDSQTQQAARAAKVAAVAAAMVPSLPPLSQNSLPALPLPDEPQQPQQPLSARKPSPSPLPAPLRPTQSLSSLAMTWKRTSRNLSGSGSIVAQLVTEEAVVRWLGSLGVVLKQPERLLEEASDSIAVLQAVDALRPGTVNWRTVCRPRDGRSLQLFQKMSNFNCVADAGRVLGLPLSDVDPKGFSDGSSKAIFRVFGLLMNNLVMEVVDVPGYAAPLFGVRAHQGPNGAGFDCRTDLGTRAEL